MEQNGPKSLLLSVGIVQKNHRILTFDFQDRRNNFGSLQPDWLYSGLEGLYQYPYKIHLPSVPAG
jgi:hypothetical protein